MPRGLQSHYRPDVTQTVAYTASAVATTNAFGAQINVVRVVSTTDCFIEFLKTPVATTSDTFLPALSVEYFTVTQGQKLSAIRSSSDGSIFVTEMTQ